MQPHWNFFFLIVTLRDHTALEKQSKVSLQRIYHPFKQFSVLDKKTHSYFTDFLIKKIYFKVILKSVKYEIPVILLSMAIRSDKEPWFGKCPKDPTKTDIVF